MKETDEFVIKFIVNFISGNPIGNFGSPQSTAGAVPGMFNTSPMNSVANSFPKLQTTSQPVLQVCNLMW